MSDMAERIREDVVELLGVFPFRLGNLAHRLSNTMRFCGVGAPFSSVLRHSVSVAKIVRWREGIRATDAVLYALLHDAHEALTGEVPRAYKTADYAALCRDVQVVIWEHLGLPTSIMLQQADVVKRADTDEGNAEAHYFGTRDGLAVQPDPRCYSIVRQTCRQRPGHVRRHFLRQVSGCLGAVRQGLAVGWALDKGLWDTEGRCAHNALARGQSDRPNCDHRKRRLPFR